MKSFSRLQEQEGHGLQLQARLSPNQQTHPACAKTDHFPRTCAPVPCAN